MAEPIEMPFGGLVGWAQKTCITWGADPQVKGQFLWVVCHIEKHWEPLLRCVQKRLKRSRCHLAGWLTKPRSDESIRHREGWQERRFGRLPNYCVRTLGKQRNAAKVYGQFGGTAQVFRGHIGSACRSVFLPKWHWPVTFRNESKVWEERMEEAREFRSRTFTTFYRCGLISVCRTLTSDGFVRPLVRQADVSAASFHG